MPSALEPPLLSHPCPCASALLRRTSWRPLAAQSARPSEPRSGQMCEPHPALHGRVEAADAVGEYDPDRPAPLPAGTESLEHGVQHDHRHVRGRQLFPWLRRLQGAARAAPPSAAARSFRAGSASACGDSCMPAPAATDRHTSACSDRQTFQRLQRRPPNPRRPVRRCASASSLRAPSSSLAMNGASPCEATTYTIASPAQSIASTSRCTQRGMRQRWAGLTVHAPAPAWPPAARASRNMHRCGL